MSEPSVVFLPEEVQSSQPPPPSSSSSSSPSPLQHRRHGSVLFTFVIVISLLANIVLVCMVVLNWKPWNTENQPSGAGPETSGQSGTADKLCFTCDNLGPAMDSNTTVYEVIRPSETHKLCCVTENNNATKVFRQILADHYKQTRSGISPSASQFGLHNGITGAHLSMRPQEDSPPVWTTSDLYNINFCSGVACREGNITVEEAGMYLVYTHITLRQDSLFMNQNLLHSVRRFNPQLRRLGTHLVLFSKSSPKETSFLSAILRLRKDDILWVTIPKEYFRCLDTGLFSNYFGVMKL